MAVLHIPLIKKDKEEKWSLGEGNSEKESSGKRVPSLLFFKENILHIKMLIKVYTSKKIQKLFS